MPNMSRKISLVVLLLAVVFTLGGCSGFFSSSGPSRAQITDASKPEERESPISIVTVNNAVAMKLLNAYRSIRFSDGLSASSAPENLIGPGDALDVLIWEAPPAILFPPGGSGGSAAGPLASAGKSTTPPATSSPSLSGPMTTLPVQVVNRQGTIVFPFIGKIQAAGKTLSQIESQIIEKLAGKANQPQVIVRLAVNSASTVTVVGEVTNNILMALTPKGERLLEAIASAGGVKAPVNKITIQVSRKGQTKSLPMETVIQDPKQNIALLPGDVVTAYYQPLSVTVLGATGKNDELMFEAQGIMLSQALARVGGLVNSLSDSRGVYIFRYEDPNILDLKTPTGTRSAPGEELPVVYRFDMEDPSTFFASQHFPMKDKDMVYVATASSVELLKFLSIISSVLAPAQAVNAATLSGLK